MTTSKRLSAYFGNETYGGGIAAGYDQDVKILASEGIESFQTDSKLVENALTDGGYVASTRAGMRRLTFDLAFHDGTRWADIPGIFPLGSEILIRLTRDGATRYITGYRDSDIVPLGNKGSRDIVQCQISFICPDPYFRTYNFITVQDAGTISGGLEYDDIEYDGISYQTITPISSLAMNNIGDYPVGFKLDIAFSDAASSLTISLGRDLMVFGAFAAGDRLIIDTSTKNITVNGANGFPYFTSGSFLRLPRGVSTMAMSAFVGVAQLSYEPIYEAI